MDTTTTITLIILGAIVLVGLYFYNRNRVKPRGAFDDENYRSGGSIGGSSSSDNAWYPSSRLQ